MRAFIFFMLASALLFTALIRPAAPTDGVTATVTYFRAEAPLFSSRCDELLASIRTIDLHDSSSVAASRQKLYECRIAWKKIESFLEYFFASSSRIYNRAPKFEPEAPSMEYQSPIGLQVIESLLFTHPEPDTQRQLEQQAEAVASSASDLLSLLYAFTTDDRQVLESIRLELIRVITLDITGYDAPLLLSGIDEAGASLRAIQHQLEPWQPGDSLCHYLSGAIAFCDHHKDFASFDRLAFIKRYALPLQHQLHLLIKSRHLTLPSVAYGDLFSPGMLDQHPVDAALAARGRKLFFDKSLSGNGSRSCATCHDPSKAFTDGNITPPAFDGHSFLPRNAPSLLYSALQHRQFWDGRAASLEEQITIVLKDPMEMRTADTSQPHTSGMAAALAAYIHTLQPMDSPFDRYLRGDHDSISLLTPGQIRGANLFMGKAQCATCHFMPVFNGLIPPNYSLTEFETLGTTRTDSWDHPQLSPDQGRYSIYPLPFLMGAFKTPTVRNTALTGPYMHNGAFRTLEKVLEFYNQGGAQGLGLDLPAQTLSPQPLHLTKEEMHDIIAFLHSLTDTP